MGHDRECHSFGANLERENLRRKERPNPFESFALSTALITRQVSKRRDASDRLIENSLHSINAKVTVPSADFRCPDVLCRQRLSALPGGILCPSREKGGWSEAPG
jgi:hypothetical protein